MSKDKIIKALLQCYYDQETNRGSTLPFVGSLKDAEIRALWVALAATVKK